MIDSKTMNDLGYCAVTVDEELKTVTVTSKSFKVGDVTFEGFSLIVTPEIVRILNCKFEADRCEGKLKQSKIKTSQCIITSNQDVINQF